MVKAAELSALDTNAASAFRTEESIWRLIREKNLETSIYVNEVVNNLRYYSQNHGTISPTDSNVGQMHSLSGSQALENSIENDGPLQPDFRKYQLAAQNDTWNIAIEMTRKRLIRKSTWADPREKKGQFVLTAVSQIIEEFIKSAYSQAISQSR